MPDIIHFHRVSHRYEGTGDVLSDVTFTLAKGEMAFLTGPSGAGKSTLLKLVALLERPTRGQIVVNGQNLAGVRPGQIPAFRQQIGVVFQNFNLLYDRSVFDNVALPLVIRGIGHDDIGRRVRAARKCRRSRSPAASSSASALPAPSSPSRSCCWPTSPPATSIRKWRAR